MKQEPQTAHEAVVQLKKQAKELFEPGLMELVRGATWIVRKIIKAVRR